MSFPHAETWQAVSVLFNRRIIRKKPLGFDPAWGCDGSLISAWLILRHLESPHQVDFLSSLKFRVFTDFLKCKYKYIKNPSCLKMIFSICIMLYITDCHFSFSFLYVLQTCRIVFCIIHWNIFRQLLTTNFNLLFGQLSNRDECPPHAAFGRYESFGLALSYNFSSLSNTP